MARLSVAERATLGAWAADCAERVLPLFEAAAPGDPRPRAAIEGIRGFVRGELAERRVTAPAVAAHAAARAVDDPAATAAARAAGVAGAVAAMHAPDTIGTARHAIGAAMYAALARELAAGGDQAAADAEIRWALAQASPALRAVYRTIARPPRSQSRLGAIEAQLDAALRG